MLSPAQKLGAKLRDAFKSANVPVRTIATACGISEAGVYSWFRTGRVDKRHLPIIAKLANKSLGELLAHEGFVHVEPAKGMEITPVELPRDANRSS